METTLTNSLFRFVTFRAPEARVLSAANTNTGFTEHPKTSSSLIYSAVKNGQTLKQAADAYHNTAYTEEDIIGMNPALTEFGQYLSKNADSITLESLSNIVKPSPFFDEELYILWDNLFYQMATQQSMYAKDRIIELLIADHFVRNWILDSAQPIDFKKLAKTRVVAPQELFEPPASTTVGAVPPVVSETNFNGSVKQNEALALLIAKDKLGRYGKAVEELKKAQQAYMLTEQERYQAILSDYNKSVVLFINASKEGWTPDPENPEASSYDQYDLPQFNYTPAAEMTDTQLSTLSAESKYIVILYGLQTLLSYDKALKVLEEKQAGETKSLFEKSKFSDSVVIAGGTAIQVTDHLQLPGHERGYSMQLIPVAAGKYRLGLVLNTGGENTGIIASKFSINNGPYILNDKIRAEPVGDQQGILFYPVDGFSLSESGQAQYFLIDVELQLKDGSKVSFEKELSFNPNDGTTVFSGTYTGPETPLSNPFNPQPAPSTHGFKKLGIADYRKVEQSICCYVPGEVSHIENVMAKEYKERSTRNLRRTEDTTTTENQTERESQTDTTSTERYEMQQETASILNDTKATALSSGVNTSFSGTGYMVAANMNGSYASNISKQLSLRQATDFAKEVTIRASEKVIQRVREERISKIIEEYEERNTHGFDNRGEGAENISGVYRWVDKVYKNQIVNYGVRTMYEFMIPQPAVFHKQAMTSLPLEAIVLEKPIDPRTTSPAIATPLAIDRTNYAHWAAVYNADVEAPPSDKISIGKVLAGGSVGSKDVETELISEKENVKIPEGYLAIYATANATGVTDGDGKAHSLNVAFGNQNIDFYVNGVYNRSAILTPSSPYISLMPFENEIPVSMYATNFFAAHANLTIHLQLTGAAFEQWKVETFNAIMKAYNAKLDEYNKAYAAARANMQQVKEANPLFYRRIENTILKKNCIAYLVGQTYMGGQALTAGTGSNVYAQLSTAVDNYASVVSFMEQAFEWEIMSYSFYPFYWGEQAGWNTSYTYENDDPLFRAFMQSGMARVIATVRPGFEDAVMYYLSTGQVWLGGHVPVIGDPLYTSIMDTLTAFKETPEGEPWETKVPTSLTVLQNSTTGLDAEGLPCSDDCSDEQYFFSSDNKLTRLKKDDE